MTYNPDTGEYSWTHDEWVRFDIIRDSFRPLRRVHEVYTHHWGRINDARDRLSYTGRAYLVNSDLEYIIVCSPTEFADAWDKGYRP